MVIGEIFYSLVDVVGVERCPLIVLRELDRRASVQDNIQNDVTVVLDDLLALVNCCLQVHVAVGAAVHQGEVTDGEGWLEGNWDAC